MDGKLVSHITYAKANTTKIKLTGDSPANHMENQFGEETFRLICLEEHIQKHMECNDERPEERGHVGECSDITLNRAHQVAVVRLVREVPRGHVDATVGLHVVDVTVDYSVSDSGN